MNKVSGWWRIAAIILIVIVLGFSALMVYGYQIQEKTYACSEYCYNRGLESFQYDYQTKWCDCYAGSEIKDTIFMN